MAPKATAHGSSVTGTKYFYAVKAANWPSTNGGIPSGWTRVNIDE